MPYRQAHYFIGLTLIVIVVGFWSSYFVPIADVPLAFHVHAFTAVAWVLLLLFQHWSIHSKQRKLHKLAGKLSLALFPLLIVGFVMIINVTAKSYVESQHLGDVFLGPSFALSMLFAIVAYLVLYYQALKHRRHTRLHAGYMLTTPLVLFESPFSRILLSYLPFLVFTNSDFPQRILDAIVISMGLAIVFAIGMYLRDRKGGIPFLVAAGLMILQAIAMYVGTHSETVRAAFLEYARIPEEITVLFGFLLGAAVAYRGWRQPLRGKPIIECDAIRG